jgi:hypothetical protein
MCLSAGADDRVDRAGWQAFDTSNASIFVDDRNQGGSLDSIVGVQRQYLALKQPGQGCDGRCATGRALVDLRGAVGNRFRIGSTAVVAAARALRLWEERVDVVGKCHCASGSAELG